MMRGLIAAVALLSLQGASPDAEELYRAHRWFELRAAITPESPAFLRGAVAAAFNEAGPAETLLLSVIASDSQCGAANDSYKLLTQLYFRSGDYASFIIAYDQWAAQCPASSDLQDARGDRDKSSGRPNQGNGPRHAAMLRHGPDDFTLPVSIGGKTDDFLFDSGAWQSVLTEREAAKLGLRIGDERRAFTGSSGDSADFRVALADDVVIGGTHFRNVSFAVIASGPFRDAEVGIIGMPILLGLGSLKWSPDGTVAIGRTTPRSSSPNLVFRDNRLMLQAKVLGTTVLTTLDTGARTTDLNANFADIFPQLIEHGKRVRQDITGVGGTQTFDAVELPEVLFAIGRRTAWLRPGVVTLQRMAQMGGECCVGNAGHDLLAQGKSFTIDFASMTLQIE